MIDLNSISKFLYLLQAVLTQSPLQEIIHLTLNNHQTWVEKNKNNKKLIFFSIYFESMKTSSPMQKQIQITLQT